MSFGLLPLRLWPRNCGRDHGQKKQMRKTDLRRDIGSRFVVVSVQVCELWRPKTRDTEERRNRMKRAHHENETRTLLYEHKVDPRTKISAREKNTPQICSTNATRSRSQTASPNGAFPCRWKLHRDLSWSDTIIDAPVLLMRTRADSHLLSLLVDHKICRFSTHAKRNPITSVCQHADHETEKSPPESQSTTIAKTTSEVTSSERRSFFSGKSSMSTVPDWASAKVARRCRLLHGNETDRTSLAPRNSPQTGTEPTSHLAQNRFADTCGGPGAMTRHILNLFDLPRQFSEAGQKDVHGFD